MLATKGPETNLSPLGDDSIVELSLMMSRCQFEALEEQAGVRSMSVAQFLRRLVQKSLDQDRADHLSN